MTPGFLLIDKPPGPTSHDVVSRVRRATGEKRVGHAGTLDPFASGLLLVGVGREATRELGKFVGLDKWYEATFLLGVGSDTDDITGTIRPSIPNTRYQIPNTTQINTAISTLTGPLNQIPPSYAAIKIGGKKMYAAAREGKPLVAPPRPVVIHSFELVEFHVTDYGAPSSVPPQFQTPVPQSLIHNTVSIRVRIHCSSGTYIRSLARDLGQALGTKGLVTELRRTSIGPFSISESLPLSTLSAPSATPAPTALLALLPIESTLSRLPPSATIHT